MLPIRVALSTSVASAASPRRVIFAKHRPAGRKRPQPIFVCFASVNQSNTVANRTPASVLGQKRCIPVKLWHKLSRIYVYARSRSILDTPDSPVLHVDWQASTRGGRRAT